MNTGDIVIILGKLDTKVREKSREKFIYGTIEQILTDDRISVILENNDLWVGYIYEVVLKGTQDE